MSMFLLAALAAGTLGAQDPEAVPVRVLAAGAETRIAAEEFHRIGDREAWSRLWRRHTGKKEPAPAIDFDREMVVAVFLGECAWERLDVYDVKRGKDEIVFGVVVQGRECCDFTRRPAFLIAVVPRSDLKLALIQRVREDLGVDPDRDRLLAEFPDLRD